MRKVPSISGYAILTKRTITSNHNSLSTKKNQSLPTITHWAQKEQQLPAITHWAQKGATTYDVGNSGPGLGDYLLYSVSCTIFCMLY